MASFTALINGEVKGNVLLANGIVKGLSSFDKQYGFHLVAETSSSYREFSGLYVWPTMESVDATHYGDRRRAVRSLADDTYALVFEDKTIAVCKAKDGLPLGFPAFGLRVASWKSNRYIEKGSLVSVEDDVSTIAFSRVSTSCYVSINEHAWYAKGRSPRTIVLMDPDAHCHQCLAAKYDVFEFKDRLCDDAAKAYAREVLIAVGRTHGAQPVLDIGSGAVSNGPFADVDLRRAIATEWFALDVSQQHFEANSKCVGVVPLRGDITTFTALPGTASMAVAKDSLNNLPWPSLKRVFEKLQASKLRYLVTNGTPGFDNRIRSSEMESCDGDVWSYRRFDPAGDELSLKLVKIFDTPIGESHAGTWGLYSLKKELLE